MDEAEDLCDYVSESMRQDAMKQTRNIKLTGAEVEWIRGLAAIPELPSS